MNGDDTLRRDEKTCDLEKNLDFKVRGDIEMLEKMERDRKILGNVAEGFAVDERYQVMNKAIADIKKDIDRVLIQLDTIARETGVGLESKITIERFIEIMEEERDTEYIPDGIYQGIGIVRKYLKGADVKHWDQEGIHICEVKELVDREILEEDIVALAERGWFVSDKKLVIMIFKEKK